MTKKIKYFATVKINNEIVFGIVNPEENTIVKLTESYFSDNFMLTTEVINLNSKIKFLPPCKPTKIVCVGLNYTDHAYELNLPVPQEPIIFLKPPSATIGHKDKIIYPSISTRVDYEGELAVVIKKKSKNISPEKVHNYLLGYTCFNDITARDIQKKDVQWTRAKSFDTFAPFGPWIASKELNVKNLAIKTTLNGKIVQNSNTKNLIFGIEFVVSFVSKIMTLYPEDIITLGTPAGVGELKRGDTITVNIENIGELINYVE